MSDGLLAAPNRVSLSLPRRRAYDQASRFVFTGGFSRGRRLGQGRLVPSDPLTEFLVQCTEYHKINMLTERVYTAGEWTGRLLRGHRAPRLTGKIECLKQLWSMSRNTRKTLRKRIENGMMELAGGREYTDDGARPVQQHNEAFVEDMDQYKEEE